MATRLNEYDITTKYTAEFLRDLTYLEQNCLLSEARRFLFELRHQDAPFKGLPGPVPNGLWKKVKKDIARILTIMNERNKQDESNGKVHSSREESLCNDNDEREA
ncbi:hypothetical protein LCGC14_1928990 [marine sediment metagenome]|uniref:Uncharacterized protein n=1 Tax=marine sediment metagenome TaxID=412755 RepID=A0A0F9GBZ4_9ZZZZ